MSFRILYQDDSFVAIEKPAGFHVHPPEDAHRISRSVNCLYLVKKQLETYVYPVHRLDRATSGVLLFALRSDSAKRLCHLFQEQKIKKTYFCVTRGWTEESGMIHYPLPSENESSEPLVATTAYQRIGQIELPHAVGRYPTARYSLLQVEPHSGRRHQIRRHLNHLSHPLIGDTLYGNGDHNRLFRDQLKIPGLLLKAYCLEFVHPERGDPVRIISRWSGLWHSVFDLFGVCPRGMQ